MFESINECLKKRYIRNNFFELFGGNLLLKTIILFKFLNLQNKNKFNHFSSTHIRIDNDNYRFIVNFPHANMDQIYLEITKIKKDSFNNTHVRYLLDIIIDTYNYQIIDNNIGVYSQTTWKELKKIKKNLKSYLEEYLFKLYVKNKNSDIKIKDLYYYHGRF